MRTTPQTPSSAPAELATESAPADSAATIVLVPGAGLGGWAWSRVTPLLEAAGHDVHAVTLTGLHTDDDRDATEIDLHTHVDDLTSLLEREQLEDVVLVGHSFSGNAITGAAAQAPERIGTLVYLDADIPQDGVSSFEAAGPEFEQAIVAIAQADADPSRLTWFDDETLDTYYPGNEISAEDRAWIRANAAGHPLATFRDRLSLPDADETLPPRTYVTCLRRAFPGPIDTGTPGWAHATLDAGHWPMVTRPRETADLLDELAR